LAGHVDNSSYPSVTVDMDVVLVTPADAKQPVPAMIMFGFPLLPGEPLPEWLKRFQPPSGGDPPPHEQLIAAGWGYAVLSPMSVQPDNGAGLTKGIIGLV